MRLPLRTRTWFLVNELRTAFFANITITNFSRHFTLSLIYQDLLYQIIALYRAHLVGSIITHNSSGAKAKERRLSAVQSTEQRVMKKTHSDVFVG
jgi:hypothetical protein